MKKKINKRDMEENPNLPKQEYDKRDKEKSNQVESYIIIRNMIDIIKDGSCKEIF